MYVLGFRFGIGLKEERSCIKLRNRVCLLRVKDAIFPNLPPFQETCIRWMMYDFTVEALVSEVDHWRSKVLLLDASKDNKRLKRGTTDNREPNQSGCK